MDELIIPASCITERSVVTATVSGKDGNKILDDWTVAEVDRGKSSL